LLGSGHKDMPTEDRDFLQGYILDFYETFLDRVAEGRKMPKDQVRKIAGGRIYTGRQALEVGLVDRLGGLEDAVAAVREMAAIPASAEIKLIHYPRPSTLGDIAESFMGVSTAGISAPDLLAQMQAGTAPAPVVSFDSQLRYFAQAPRPLCWMAVPNLIGGASAPFMAGGRTIDLLAEFQKTHPATGVASPMGR
jgi:ClpP class serine protease